MQAEETLSIMDRVLSGISRDGLDSDTISLVTHLSGSLSVDETITADCSRCCEFLMDAVSVLAADLLDIHTMKLKELESGRWSILKNSSSETASTIARLSYIEMASGHIDLYDPVSVGRVIGLFCYSFCCTAVREAENERLQAKAFQILFVESWFYYYAELLSSESSSQRVSASSSSFFKTA